MKKIITLLFSLLISFNSNVVWGADFKKGIEAYYSGDFENAVKEIQPLAEQGDASSQYVFGFFYETGFGVPQNFESALKWYSLSAIQGYPRAHHSIGRLYFEGLGLSQDYETARKWFSYAAKEGVSDSQNSLGLIYEKGLGVSQDYQTAVKWYTLGAEQGYSESQSNLGKMYEEGWGVPQDYQTAIKWYTLAAEKDYSIAQYNLAVMYLNGLGVSQDYQIALRWFTLAAEKGLSHAQNNIGAMYQDGLGVTQDFKKAVEWFSLAAEQGLDFAQSNLGSNYEDGRGVTQDYQEALKWYSLAAQQGNSQADERLRKLKKIISDSKSPSITITLLSYQQDSDHCNLTYSISNNSWGSIKGLSIRTEAFDDRGNGIDSYAWGDTISPFESYFDPLISIPIGGIAKSDDMMYEGQCKYIATIYALDVNEKFCNIRMMPNEAVCSDVMVYKSNIDHITFSRKQFINNAKTNTNDPTKEILQAIRKK